MSEIGRFTSLVRGGAAHGEPVGEIPAEPPAEVRAQVDVAARRAADLAAADRELHFAKDEETGRIVIQLRELDGRVIGTIPPSQALALMTDTP
jgi:flagellar protein FlaG